MQEYLESNIQLQSWYIMELNKNVFSADLKQEEESIARVWRDEVAIPKHVVVGWFSYISERWWVPEYLRRRAKQASRFVDRQQVWYVLRC